MQYLAVAEVYRKLAIASSGGGALLVIRMLGYWLQYPESRSSVQKAEYTGVLRCPRNEGISREMNVGMWGVVGRVAYIKIIQMNEKLSKNSFFNLPSYEKFPEFNNSLKMINTVNVFPNNNSCENIDMPMAQPVQQEEDSLDKHLNHVQTAANSAKKRRVGCTCKKTFCLKMYCECFSTGKICGDDCACTGCKNTPEFEEQIANAKTSIKEGGLRNCSLAEKRCNCKKSHCQKRYCECYNSGVSCTQACRCDGCKNHGPSQQKEQSPQQQPLVVVQQPQKGQFPSLVYRSLQDLQHFIS